ncbi:MAG: transcriptional regulator [Alkaliphilus sp.]|nr:MAG: transcriptional regulator [Alkaliphilus sp.]
MAKINLVNKRFRELRKNSNLTQAQLADFLQVDQSYVAKFEKGERRISINILEKVCNLFGCDLKYFEDEGEKFISMSIAFRSNNLQAEDLEVISAISKVARNIRFINSMLGEAAELEG